MSPLALLCSQAEWCCLKKIFEKTFQKPLDKLTEM